MKLELEFDKQMTDLIKKNCNNTRITKKERF